MAYGAVQVRRTCNAMQCNAMYNAMHNAMQCTMPCNALQCMHVWMMMVVGGGGGDGNGG
jgi:hypothetical protein